MKTATVCLLTLFSSIFITLTFRSESEAQTSQLKMQTDWNYVRDNGPERMILNIKDPIDIQLCVNNKQATANFEVTTGTCNASETKTIPVTTGCALLGSVRRVSLLAGNNPNAAKLEGALWNVDFDADPMLPPLPTRGKKIDWTYTKPNSTTLYSDKDKASRLVRVCVANNDVAVNFTMETDPCTGKSGQFMVTGLTNPSMPNNACALVQTTTLKVESAHNPNTPIPTSGTYTLSR